MYSCFDIANYFLKLAKKEGEGIGAYRLMKLTFLAHGWYLAFKGKGLFYNTVEMWKYGVIIPELYYVTKRFGRGVVWPEIVELYSDTKLDKEHKEFISIIWNAYKKFSSLEIGAKVSEHAFYIEEKLGGKYNVPISIYLIERCYKNLISKRVLKSSSGVNG